MTFRNKKHNFLIDEATELKLQSLVGKSYLQSKDYQHIIQMCINRIYDVKQGKKLK